ncbi:S-adenosylmethionine synthase-like isoform X2 [Bolinopsis microptera]
MTTFLFTSESVGEGHPDKICDQLSDTVLDECLKQDRMSRVACESATTTGLVMIFGEITTNAIIDYQRIIRETIKEIGYDDSAKGFDYKTCGVMIAVGQQSQEIGQSVTNATDDDAEQGAGDQGLMFGYATDETEECMPLTLTLAHSLNKRLTDCRKRGILPWLRPDTKTQVTIEYFDDNGDIRPVRIHTVVLSTQHDAQITQVQLRNDIMEHVVKVVLPEHLLDDDTVYHINPSGSFVVGGPCGDAGLTGRKIIVDTYGGWGAHGGGAFSGKDPTKVDRSAAYAARWVAKSLVKAGVCRRVLVQVSYAIGIALPLSVSIFAYGTCKYTESQLLQIVQANFDLSAGNIVKELDLRRPIYRQTAKYGHFGNPEFSWEQPKDISIPENLC